LEADFGGGAGRIDFRDDHALRDDANWMKHTLATRLEDGTVSLDYKPVEGDAYMPMERKY